MCNFARDVLLVYMYMTTGGQERGREGGGSEGEGGDSEGGSRVRQGEKEGRREG